MKNLKEAAAMEFFNSFDNLFNRFTHCVDVVLSLGGG